MKGRRVAVTGLGIVSPVGNSADSCWDNICKGRSGIATITRFDPSGFGARIAGEVEDFVDAPGFSPKDARRNDLFIRYGLTGAAQALADADLGVGNFDPDRAGVVIGSGIGGLPFIASACKVMENKGPGRVSPFFVPSTIVNMCSGWVSMLNNLRGPSMAPATACTTGTHSIGDAARMIAYGDADVMVCGGAESAITPISLAGFGNARALSARNDDPAGASRPFAADRDGFVLGEGAGILVLEEMAHARARDVRVYCELIGYGMSSDAHHITAPPEGGDGAYRAMANAVKDAGRSVDEIEHINAHGTSTLLGDIAETSAIRNLFGAHTDNLTVSATKSMTGHLLGAAGGIEALFTVLAMVHQAAPPTINLAEPGEGCDLDYVAGRAARPQAISTAMTNSFGFGGTNASLIFTV